MGGKHKQAQRTKNNARPSSSGRSAELLRNSSTFVGFSSGKDGSSGVLPGYTLNPDEVNAAGNSEVNIVMKKMYKKDATTKLKALQEFAELCKRSDSSYLKSLLPQWPHIYNILAMDADHRVREASHQAQRQLAVLAKKSLAPYLKSLAGPWFTGQYDTYPPAASAARLAFQDAFPPTKIPEAIAFCQEEIFNYICENLMNHSPSTLSNLKNSSEEEMEAKHTRVLTSSLQGYAHFLQLVPIAALKNSELENKKLVSSAKFWKHARNPSPMVRSSWFSTLIALCQKAPFLLVDEGSRVANSVFGNLDEMDPCTLPVVWEAALHALVAIKDCWSHVDPHKIVFPKLLRVLREGGQGNSSKIYPNLLPLLSKMPSELLSDKELFYRRFFESMREGFNQPSVQLSQSESNAVSVTFIECLRYIVLVHQSEPAFCMTLITEQLVPVLQASFVHRSWELHRRPFYSEVSSLIHHWHRNFSESSCFEELANCFWVQAAHLVSKNIQEREENFAIISKRKLEFISYLKDPNRKRMKEYLRVRFVEPEEKRNPPSDNVNEAIVDLPQSPGVEEQLLDIVFTLCIAYSDAVDGSDSYVLVDALSDVILEFNSQKLLCRLAKNASIGEASLSVGKLLQWVQNPAMPTSKVVKILLLIIIHLDVKEKERILCSLLELENVAVLQFCLIDAVTSHYSDVCVRKWLKSSKLSEMLVNIVLKVSTSSLNLEALCETDEFIITWNVLKSCFSQTPDGDYPVTIETLIKIVKILSDSLSSKVSPSATHKDPNSSAKFVGELTCTLFNRDSSSTVPLVLMILGEEERCFRSQPAGSVLCDLALSLYSTCCIGLQHTSVLQTSTLSLLDRAWQTLISSVAQALEIGNTINPFLDVTDRFVRETWMSISPLSEVSSLEVASTQAVGFMKSALIGSDYLHSKETVLVSLCKSFFEFRTNSSDWDNWTNESVTGICLAAELLRNASHTRKDVLITESEPEMFLLSITISLFTVIVLSKLGKYLKQSSSVEDNDNAMTNNEEFIPSGGTKAFDDSEACKNCDLYAKFLISFSADVVEALNIFTLCKLFLLHYKNDPLCVKVNPRCSILQENLKSVIASMGEMGLEHLKNDIICQMEKHNGLGLWTMKYLYSELLNEKDMFGIFMDLKSNALLNPYKVQLIQVFSPFLPGEDLEEFASESANTLLSYACCETVEVMKDRVWPYGYLSIIACIIRNQETNAYLVEEGADMEDFIQAALDSIIQKRQCGSYQILTGGDLSMWMFMETLAAVEIADFLEACVKKRVNSLSPHQWDMLLCFLVTQLQSLASISESSHDGTRGHWWNSVDRAALASSVFRLTATVVGSIEGTGPKDTEMNDSSLFVSKELISEWKDVYAAEVYHPLLRILCHMIDRKGNGGVTWDYVQVLLCEDILQPARLIPDGYLSKCPFPCLLDYKGTSRASCIATYLVASLRSPTVSLQTSAYLLILKLIPELLDEDKKILAEEPELEKVYERLSCHKLQDHLTEAQSVVDIMLMDFSIGDSCTVQPFTDTYTYTSAYFLQWKIILEMCRVAESELRCHYAQWLRDTAHLNSLLHNLFRLLPEQILRGCSMKLNSPPSRKLSGLFVLPADAYNGAITAEDLEHLVCWVWVDAFRYLPALARLWWNDLGSRSNALVERVTALHLSQYLCAEEMRAVQAEEKTFSNMNVKVHPSAREVIAVYCVDDAETELLIQLPNNHPLGLVKVDSGKYLFGTNQRHNWLRQITIFLNYQNGSIWDGLALWKKNLDKRFEGVEECFICYSILHNSNYQIPKLSCQTCKKKFHSQCLYKWFSTSNNSTCPICRNLWKY